MVSNESQKETPALTPILEMVLLVVQSGEASVQESVVLLKARVGVVLMLEAWLGVASVRSRWCWWIW